MSDKIKVVVCGVHGYVGNELAKLILVHPTLSLIGVTARQTQQELYQEMPFLEENAVPLITLKEIDEKTISTDVVFLATPPEISMESVVKLAGKVKIIDLSGAFRLTETDFQNWYGIKHLIPELLSTASYGLSPWSNCNTDSSIVANPGCYATCALMSLIPVLKENVIKSSNIIIDAKSGVSGAGRNPKSELMFCEIANNFYPYKIGKHQHTPEIHKGLLAFSGKLCDIVLMTHLLPIVRGISMSIYADACDQYLSDNAILAAISESFTVAYNNYPLVKHGSISKTQSFKDKFLLSLKNVVGTYEIHIGYFVKDRKVFIFSCIDNLLKGAASQAIENVNALYNLPLLMGLTFAEETL